MTTNAKRPFIFFIMLTFSGAAFGQCFCMLNNAGEIWYDCEAQQRSLKPDPVIQCAAANYMRL
jgi:hypothetical protein